MDSISMIWSNQVHWFPVPCVCVCVCVCVSGCYSWYQSPGLDPEDQWWLHCCGEFQDSTHLTRDTNWTALLWKEGRELRCPRLARRRFLGWFGILLLRWYYPKSCRVETFFSVNSCLIKIRKPLEISTLALCKGYIFTHFKAKSSNFDQEKKFFFGFNILN